MKIENSQLTPNHLRILELVNEWGVIDREQIAALCTHDRFSPDGVRTALGRMVKSGLLSSDLRSAHHPKAEIGIAAKRAIYYIAEGGRTCLGLGSEERRRLTNKVKKYVYTPPKLPHDVGVSWVHTLLELGHKQGCWNLDWCQGKETELKADSRRHRPDGVARMTTFAPFTRYVEYEHRNKGERTRSHARFYFQALSSRAIDGRVLWVGRSEAKLRALRAAIVSEAPEARALFIFVSQDQIDLQHPERLSDPVFLTAGEDLAPIIPMRKDAKRLR